MAQEKGEGQHEVSRKVLAKMNLSKEQCDLIRQATGIDVTELEVHEVTGDAARLISPAVLSAKFVVACW
jgi:hypothetical protein